MAESKIILDLANSTADTITALKRAKVLFGQLGRQELNQWVANELTGYPDDAELPDYRIVEGYPIVSYTRGSLSSYTKYTNLPLSLGKMPDDMQKSIRSVELRDGIAALRVLADSTNDIAKTIPAEIYPAIAKYNNDPFMMVYSAQTIVSKQLIQNVFSTIENRLLDALILLEKEFGSLDNLDIDTTTKTPDEIERIEQSVYVMIFNDNSVTIGNNNRFKNTDINTHGE